jgi:hypothetical protein
VATAEHLFQPETMRAARNSSNSISRSQSCMSVPGIIATWLHSSGRGGALCQVWEKRTMRAATGAIGQPGFNPL